MRIDFTEEALRELELLDVDTREQIRAHIAALGPVLDRAAPQFRSRLAVVNIAGYEVVLLADPTSRSLLVRDILRPSRLDAREPAALAGK
jgi:hypothetical protein